MMDSAQDPLASRRRLIVHHLSDLLYEDSVTTRQNDMFASYQRYLGSLPVERHPDIVVITGNLTATGKRKDLSAVATTLRTYFFKWTGHLHERVFIVPGPRDVSWERSTSIGLDAFYEIFGDFALPNRIHIPSGQGATGNGAQDFIGYPINTCYSPDELPANLTGNFKRYAASYRRFVNRRGKLNTRWMGIWPRSWRPRKRNRTRARTDQLASLRKQFLDLTEGELLVDLRAGRITEPDVERFERWAQPIIQSASQGAGAVSPLKILIMHHPFTTRAERGNSPDATLLPQNLFKKAMETAGAADFHLVLHGHLHKPQLLTDMLLEGPDRLHPMRQVGAPSLGETGIFNEITAEARSENGHSVWHLDLHPVNLKAGTDPNMFRPPSEAEAANKQIKQLIQDALQRSEFERAMRVAMRRFTEQVYDVGGTNWQGPSRQGANWPGGNWPGGNWQEWANTASLPQEAMALIQEIVRDVFPGYEVRVRLLLKSKEDRGAIPKLVPAYLTPAVMEGPEALVYPASVAAWALILGRTLIYPAIKDEHTGSQNYTGSQGYTGSRDYTGSQDYDWLRRTAKIEPLLSALHTLMEEAKTNSLHGLEALARYGKLHKSLEEIRGATTGVSNAMISEKDIYQPAPDGSPAQSYPNFICVPYPMRSEGGPLPALPETMVLDIAVRRSVHLGRQRETRAAGPAEPFTAERIRMLEMLAELVGMILTTASTLGRPHGVWDDRHFS